MKLSETTVGKVKKISQMTTEEARTYFCEVLPYINDVMSSEELSNKMKQAVGANYNNMSTAQRISTGVQIVNDLVPYLLDTKAESVYHILALSTNQTVDTIKNQKFFVTISQVKELFDDQELKELFT